MAEAASIGHLPDEVLADVLRLAGRSSQAAASLVQKKWHQIIASIRTSPSLVCDSGFATLPPNLPALKESPQAVPGDAAKPWSLSSF